jgi:hypothetical protein
MNYLKSDLLQIVSAFEVVMGITREELLKKKRDRRSSSGRNMLTAIMSLHPIGYTVGEIGAIVGRTYDVGISLWPTIIFQMSNYEDSNTQFNDILDILDHESVYRKYQKVKQKTRTKVFGKYYSDHVMFINGSDKPVIINRRPFTEKSETTLNQNLELFKERLVTLADNIDLIACVR